MLKVRSLQFLRVIYKLLVFIYLFLRLLEHLFHLPILQTFCCPVNWQCSIVMFCPSFLICLWQQEYQLTFLQRYYYAQYLPTKIRLSGKCILWNTLHEFLHSPHDYSIQCHYFNSLKKLYCLHILCMEIRYDNLSTAFEYVCRLLFKYTLACSLAPDHFIYGI